MNSFRKVFVAGFATLLLAGACTSITIPTLPPGASIPPIPTLPPGFTVPPIPSNLLPSGLPGIGGTPAPGTADACALITQAEASQAMGSQATMVPDESGTCTITPSDSLFPIIVRYGTGETIATAKLIAGNGQDLTVAGLPAYYGEFAGGLLYVERNGQDLVFQAALQNDMKDVLVALANAAVPRWQ